MANKTKWPNKKSYRLVKKKIFCSQFGLNSSYSKIQKLLSHQLLGYITGFNNNNNNLRKWPWLGF